MNSQPDQLSKLLLEADGLLLLLHRHRDETPIDAIKILRKKLELILALTEGLDEEPANIDQPVSPTAEAALEVAEDTIAQEPEDSSNTGSIIVEDVDDYTKYQPLAVDDEPSSIGEYIEDTIEDPRQEEPAEHTEAEDSQKAENMPAFIDDTVQPIFIDEQNESTVFFGDEPLQPVYETISESEPQYEPEQEHAHNTADSTPDYEPCSEPAQAAAIPEPQIYHRTYIINESADATEQHTSRRPVSSVFNLNDKFRFRRELFGNSDAQYVECLDILSAMKSIDEAKEYLYEDLKWEPENDDVKAFVELLANYYR